jgi:hypothetical protein
MARPTGKPTKTIPVRFSPELREKIRLAAKIMNWKEVDVVRLATSIGLVRLKRLDYDLAEVLDSAAEEHPGFRAAAGSTRAGVGARSSLLAEPTVESSRLNEPSPGDPPSEESPRPITKARAALRAMGKKEKKK